MLLEERPDLNVFPYSVAPIAVGVFCAVAAHRFARRVRGVEPITTLNVTLVTPEGEYRKAQARVPALRTTVVVPASVAVKSLRIGLSVYEQTTEATSQSNSRRTVRHTLWEHEERLPISADNVYTVDLPVPSPEETVFSVPMDETRRSLTWNVWARGIRTNGRLLAANQVIDVRPSVPK